MSSTKDNIFLRIESDDLWDLNSYNEYGVTDITAVCGVL